MKRKKTFSYKLAAISNILNNHEEFWIDESGNILSSNLEAVCVTGYDEWELIGHNISIFYTQDDYFKEYHINDLKEAKTKASFCINRVLKKRKNSLFWGKLIFESYDQQPNDHQSKVAFKLQIQDCTYHYLANIESERLEKEYERLFNSTSTGLFKVRLSDFKILSCNETAKVICSTSGGKMNDFLYELFLFKSDFEKFCTLISENKRIKAFEFILQTTPFEKWGNLSCAVLKEDDLLEIVLQDVTERKQQVVQLERLNNELQMFIYHSSHDLQSPLTSIIGLANLIDLEDPAGEKVKEYTGLIRKKIKDIDNLLRNIVSIAHNNTGSVENEDFDPLREVSNLVSEYKNNDTEILYSIDIGDEEWIYGDLHRIRTVVRQLLSNAIMFRKPAPHIQKVFLELKAEDGELKISVHDNGVGINEKMKDKIFDMFFRGSETSKGAGLGLYIVKSITKRLGGRYDVITSLGNGSSFHVYLPISKRGNYFEEDVMDYKGVTRNQA